VIALCSRKRRLEGDCSPGWEGVANFLAISITTRASRSTFHSNIMTKNPSTEPTNQISNGASNSSARRFQLEPLLIPITL
jgi:hypothetical protein